MCTPVALFAYVVVMGLFGMALGYAVGRVR